MADLYTALAAGMDKRKGVCDGVIVHDNTHMSHITTRVGTSEEHQVARLHLITTDGDVTGILVTGGTTDSDIVLSIHVTGEAGTIEGVGTLAATAIALANKGGRLIEDIIRRGETDIGVIAVSIQEIEIVNLLVNGLCPLDFLCFLFLALCQCDIHRG